MTIEERMQRAYMAAQHLSADVQMLQEAIRQNKEWSGETNREILSMLASCSNRALILLPQLQATQSD